jgi:putative ABC transport system substrate-binding protein
MGLPVEFFEVLTIDEADRALVSAARSRAGAAVFMGPASQAFLIQFRARIAATAIKHRLPTMMPTPIWVEGGGLMSYGVELRDQYRRAAVYVDKILKGVKPADLPVEQPVKLELVVNLKTAKALGVTLPQSLLLRADRIIE